MKILLTMNIPYVFAHGGANKANRLLAEGLAAAGHEVEVVVPALGIPSRLTLTEFARGLREQGIEARDGELGLSFPLAGVAVTAATDAARLRRALAERIAAQAPDFVLVSTEDPSQNLLAAALEHDPGRVVYLAHSPTFLPFGPQAFFPSPARHRLVEQVAGTIACSRFVAGYIRRHGGMAAEAIHWPAYGSGSFPDFGRFDDGYVTMVNPCAVKGLAIFAALVEALPEISFAAVPTWGTTGGNLAALADRPNLKWLRAEDDIDRIFSQTRLLLMPSLWPEGFPLTCVEAMARGVPVLASTVEGLVEAKLGTDFVLPVRPIERFTEELDQHLVPFPVIPEQDAEPWRRALLEIAGDRALYEAQSAAQKRAAREFIASLSVRPFERFLAGLTAASRPSPAAESVATAAAPAALASLSAEKQALLSLWLRKKAAEEARPAEDEPVLEAVPRARPLPLSFAQQRLWFLDQMEPGSPLYNMPSGVRLTGRLDVAALAATLGEIAARHEALRTTFEAAEGVPVQVMAPPGEGARRLLPVIDLAGLPDGRRQREARRLAAAEAARPFDLARGPLLRATLVATGAEEHALLLTLHHIVCDGWTFGILVREMTAIYEAFSARRPSPLPPLAVQYADFAVWQRRFLSGERLERLLAYWRARLTPAPVALDLPTDRPRPRLLGPGTGQRFRRLGLPLSAAAVRLAEAQGASLFMVALTGLQLLLSRLCQATDIAVGTAIANRNRAEIENLVGLFVNTLVLRTDLSGAASFGELVGRVRDVCLGAYAHQDLPFEKLVEDLNPERTLGHSPFFGTLFVLQNMPESALELPGLVLSAAGGEGETAKFDLNFTLLEGGEGLGMALRYRSDLFDGTTALRLLEGYAALLEQAVARPAAPLATLSALPAGARHQLLHEWNDTLDAAAPLSETGETVVDRFAVGVERWRDRVALVDRQGAMSYGDLWQRARRLASFLRARGIGPERRVAIDLEPSLPLGVAVWGTLAAGGAFVGLDRRLPRARLADLLTDAQVDLVLVDEPERKDFFAGLSAVVELDAWRDIARHDLAGPPWGADDQQLAYLVYTSGSTGKPKAVGNGHRQLLSYLDAVAGPMGVTEGGCFNLHQPLAVDAAFTHLFLPFLVGGALQLLRPVDLADDALLAAQVARAPIDFLKIAPSHLEALLAALDRPESLLPRNFLMLGGETSRWDLIAHLRRLTGCTLLNHYGPTETTVGSAAGRVEEDSLFASASVPIGRPLDNSRTYVLDGALEPVPPGVAAELFLGGDGVARGYLGSPDLTAERFLPDPFAGRAGARFYRTGDRARQLPDGRLELLGRTDHQIKIRGLRVELGEIEAALGDHPAVAAAVVEPWLEGGAVAGLVAYVVASRGASGQEEETLAPDALRTFLGERLPVYMVPAAFVALPALPRTSHGKVDRKALPRPAALGALGGMARDATPPRNAVEETLAALWAEVLRRDRVGIFDSFFDLGGHSLLATQLIARVRRDLAANLPLRALYERPTIAGMAEEIAALAPRRARPALVATPRSAHRRERPGRATAEGR